MNEERTTKNEQRVACGVRRAFTLVELLITVTIIAIMASMVLFALFGAQEAAREQKTRALIAKLDAIVKGKYEAYRTRRVPVQIGPDRWTDVSGGSNIDGQWDSGEVPLFDWNGNGTYDPAPPPQLAAQMRLDCIRDLMRMEMPDRLTDITSTSPDIAVAPIGFPGLKIARPSLNQAYARRLSASTTPINQNAETLYMIVMAAVAEEGDSRDVFKPDDIKDTDGDGLPEFVDAWGTPIRFLRWAPGFLDSDSQITLRDATVVAPAGMQGVFVQAAGVDNTEGAYRGGILMPLKSVPPDNHLEMEPTQARRIQNSVVQPNNQVVLELSDAPPGPLPANNTKVVILPPDPFDVRGIFSANLPFTRGAMITFAIYPLIVSAGSDKAFGMVFDTFPMAIDYPANNLNPFITNASGQYMGTQANGVGSEPDGAWRDNIQSHRLGTK